MLPPLREGETLELVKVALGAEVHPAAGAVQRGHAGQGAGGERHRPPLDLRHHPLRADRPRLRRAARGALPPDAARPLVNGMLQKGFHDILNEGYTAALEGQLDQIEDGRSPGSRPSPTST